ncbi:MAG: hypothetical protein PHV23_03245 [Candidatus Gracilibacteria bacterium]|nr:hypothetical protein [Candidatus Gracilibacteria bacterium]
MKKFLDELYENYPELENSKDSIDKAVYYLKDNKPVFSASGEFKNHLKSRIDGLIGLKINKKNNFLLFAIPLFSFVFIVAGFLYYFKDITFLNGPNNVRNFEISNLKIDNNLSNNNKQQGEEKSENNINDENTNNINKTEVVENINNKNIPSKKLDKVNSNNQEISTFSVIEDQQNTEITSAENYEISTVLDAVGETYDFKISDSVNGDYYFDSNMDSVGASISPMSDMSLSRSFKVQENYDTFTDFCSNTGGTIYEAGNDQICRVNKKECLSSNYINGTCEFIEIK